MAGKFNKNIKYRKKNFNIYKRYSMPDTKNDLNINIEKKIIKNDIKDPNLIKPEKKSGGLFKSFFDDFFEEFKK